MSDTQDALQLAAALEGLQGRKSSRTACESAVELRRQHAEITRLRAEAANLRTVMVAAAEEIAAHWDAHCDAEGYGPTNLQRRLEEGIPSEYGYTAGAFAELKAERNRLRTALAAAQGAQWQPIETAPKDGRKIIVSYVNHNGKTRTVMARWLTQEAADEIDHEGVGLEAGWFECIDNWSDYTEVAIHEGEPTHWMPIPAALAHPRSLST